MFNESRDPQTGQSTEVWWGGCLFLLLGFGVVMLGVFLAIQGFASTPQQTAVSLGGIQENVQVVPQTNYWAEVGKIIFGTLMLGITVGGTLIRLFHRALVGWIGALTVCIIATVVAIANAPWMWQISINLGGYQRNEQITSVQVPPAFQLQLAVGMIGVLLVLFIIFFLLKGVVAMYDDSSEPQAHDFSQYL